MRIAMPLACRAGTPPHPALGSKSSLCTYSCMLPCPQRINEVGGHLCSVIPLASIQHSVHLFLRFGPSAPQEWTSSNALDLCSSFYVNTFTDSHLYRTLI